jgi:hypothetical protein
MGRFMWNAAMVSNMNFPAPAAVLGFMAACGGLALSALGIVVAAFARKTRFIKPLLRVIAAGAVIYFVLLFSFSAVSRDHTLARGQEKYFCEIDCHLAYSVVSVSAEPNGSFMNYTVTVRTRFDEATISRTRPQDAPLTANPRTLVLVDGLGRKHSPVSASDQPLYTALKPGQSCLTELRFELPGDTTASRLLITSQGWPESFLIGDEQSPWHGKTWFAL